MLILQIEILLKMTYNYFDYYGNKIRYTIQGQGNTLILLHGFMESIQIWNDFSNELSKDFKVLCIELPGHGKSDLFAEIQTMESTAEMINDICKSIEIHEFVIIGHSMGGYVSLQFAELFPEKIKGLGLFHSHALADTDEAKQNRDRACEIVRKSRKIFISQFIPELFAPENIIRFDKEIKELQSHVIDMSSEAIIASQQGMKLRTDKLNVLIDLDVPKLFIAGKQDSRVNLQQLMAQAMLCNHVDILILNIGHMGYIEARNETLASIRNFTEKCFSF